MDQEKKTKKKREKRPRVLLDVSMFPHDEKGRAIVPDEFMEEHKKELPDGTRNESGTKTTYRGGILKMLGKDPEYDKEIRTAGAEALNAKLAERKTFSESIGYALRKKDVDGLSNMERITASMIIKAIDGDVKAAQFIRDTIGEQPTTKTEISADIMTAADRALLEKLEKRMDRRQ